SPSVSSLATPTSASTTHGGGGRRNGQDRQGSYRPCRLCQRTCRLALRHLDLLGSLLTRAPPTRLGAVSFPALSGPSLGSYLAAALSGATPGNHTLTTVPERSRAFPSSPSPPCAPAQCRR